MASINGKNVSTSRRKFVRDVTAGVALAGALVRENLQAQGKSVTVLNPAAGPGQKEEPKYRKLFLNELKPEEREKGFGALDMCVVFTDNDIIEGSHYFSAMYMNDTVVKGIGHGPHKHKNPELLVALGTDPDHPQDLGGEFVQYMGEEMEKHVIDKPTIILIPPNTVHCPFKVIKVRRPFIFIQAHYGPKLAEQSMKNLVPAEMRDKYVWFDLDGNQKDTYKPKARPANPKPRQ